MYGTHREEPQNTAKKGDVEKHNRAQLRSVQLLSRNDGEFVIRIQFRQKRRRKNKKAELDDTVRNILLTATQQTKRSRRKQLLTMLRM
jgi:hypothetical protein